MLKLKAARKNANAVADNPEMSEKQKLKAIQKAMKGGKEVKSNKVYVVSGRTASGTGGTKMGNAKGKVKFVDRRMKTDRRAEKRNEKKRKGKNKKR